MPVGYFGDFPASHTAVCIPFDTFAAATGAPTATTNFAAGDVLIYKDGGTTERTSSAGITGSTSFDGSSGGQMIVINLSDNTDAGFYAAGHEYQVRVGPITADGQTLTFWAGCFSIQRAGWAAMVADTFLDRDMSTGTDSGSSIIRTVRQALRFLRNKWSISGTTLTVTKEDDSTSSWTSTLTASAGADPVTASDPAGP